ncbi:MAG: PfkB family carbohydrate kinase, partial [Verrucomicrobiota bacterium]
MNSERFQKILARAANKRIAVIGDLMLDEFVWGKVDRISPEAPVPVVEVTGESFYPGGAANVARNLREFIDSVSVIGLVGADAGGRKLRKLLKQRGIDTGSVIEGSDFRTIIKTRIIARHQQVVRVDREQIR